MNALMSKMLPQVNVIEDGSDKTAAALLSRIASDLDSVPAEVPPGTGGPNDLEKAVLKSKAIERDNGELTREVDRLTTELASLSRASAAEIVRLQDQLEFVMKSNAALQQQRNDYADYAGELRVRMGNLTKVMAANAGNVEDLIISTIDSIESELRARVTVLRSVLLSNASTAKELINEAAEAAETAVVARLSADTPAA